MYDISINSNNLFVTDKIDAAIQELDLLFNTEPTELIGDVDYGTNWYNYLWSLTPMSNDLKNYIINKISQTYFASQFTPIVDVDFIQGNNTSVYVIKISLTDPNTHETVITQQYEIK